MRSKRLSILVPCLLTAIVLAFIFLHAHHRHESVAAEQPSPPTVAVIAARVGIRVEDFVRLSKFRLAPQLSFACV